MHSKKKEKKNMMKKENSRYTVDCDNDDVMYEDEWPEKVSIGVFQYLDIDMGFFCRKKEWRHKWESVWEKCMNESYQSMQEWIVRS